MRVLLIGALLIALSISAYAQTNVCNTRISNKTEGKRNVLLMGGDAYSLLEKYFSEAKSKNINVSPRSVVVHVWDGSKMQSFELNWATVLTGEPPMQIWKKKLSGIEAKLNQQELSKAYNLGWDIVCIGSTSTSEEPKRGECTPEAKNYINLGIGFVNNKQIDNAIKEFNQAIKVSPSCPLAYANLVSAYVAKKDYNLAIETYKKGIEKAGDDGFLHMTGAIAYSLRKDFDLALVSLEKSLEKGYKNVDVLVSKDLKDLRTAKKKEFCDLMSKYSVPIKECIR